MRKLIAILILFFSCASGVFHPNASMQSFNLYEMYLQCSKEDEELNTVDFVLEHVLNLEDLLDFMEGEHDTEKDEDERPHQPFQLTQSAQHFATVIPSSIQIGIPLHKELLAEKGDYSLNKENFYRQNFFGDIFHPPNIW